MINSIPLPTVANNAGMLARLGTEMGIPLVVRSTREDLDFLGTTIPEIQSAARWRTRTASAGAGTLNAFHDPAVVNAIAATGRPNLVIAGILTDVYLFNSVVSALKAEYQVTVVADACGTTSDPQYPIESGIFGIGEVFREPSA